MNNSLLDNSFSNHLEQYEKLSFTSLQLAIEKAKLQLNSPLYIPFDQDLTKW